MRFTAEGALTWNVIHLSAPLRCAWQSKQSVVDYFHIVLMPAIGSARLQTSLAHIPAPRNAHCVHACMHADVICIMSSPFTLTNSSLLVRQYYSKNFKQGPTCDIIHADLFVSMLVQWCLCSQFILKLNKNWLTWVQSQFIECRYNFIIWCLSMHVWLHVSKNICKLSIASL
jgi:hypothetical protein